MQILHVSDTHLGYAEFNQQEREEDVYEAFSEVIEFALKDKVDAVIHAGDIFHTPRPSGTALHKFAKGLKELFEKEIKFYFILGEHDISRITSTPSAYHFHTLGFATYIGDGKPVLHGDTMIIGFDKRRKGEIDGLIDDLTNAEKTSKEHRGKKILVLHQALAEFHEHAGELRSSDIPRSFDYYAMGHLHDRIQRHFEGMQGPICYPGSLDSTPQDSIKDSNKGFYFVDLSGSEVKPEWIRLKSSRSRFSFNLSYKNLNEELDKVIEELESKALSKKPILSLVIKGKDIDRSKVNALLPKVKSYCLYYRFNIIDESDPGSVHYEGKPEDLRQELLSLTEKALEDKELASFALNELLNLLTSGNEQEAAKAALEAFEEYKRRRKAL